jgi:hypothetical protein
MSILPTKAALFAAILLLSSAPAFASDDGLQFFPPKNLDAGLGFLYFDTVGGLGKQSVYAVPVQSQKLVDTEQQQTVAIVNLRESLEKISLAIQQQTDAIKALNTSSQKSSGAIQCFSNAVNGNANCVNTVTGTICESAGVGFSCRYASSGFSVTRSAPE